MRPVAGNELLDEKIDTDLIRSAIRNQLAAHPDVVTQTGARMTLVLDIQRFSAEELRAMQAAGQRVHIRCSASNPSPSTSLRS